jgi:hypothetical protein
MWILNVSRQGKELIGVQQVESKVHKKQVEVAVQSRVTVAEPGLVMKTLKAI